MNPARFEAEERREYREREMDGSSELYEGSIKAGKNGERRRRSW